jgi:hypothetical protein
VRPGGFAAKNDADSRHGDPPADGETAIRLTLISVRRPATGYPPAAGPGQELLITTAPLFKHQPGWKVDQLPDGTFRWTTPAGRSYDTEPTRYPI